MIYKRSCHCGKVAFEVEGDLNGVISCNCSICSRKGRPVHHYLPKRQLRLR